MGDGPRRSGRPRPAPNRRAGASATTTSCAARRARSARAPAFIAPIRQARPTASRASGSAPGRAKTGSAERSRPALHSEHLEPRAAVSADRDGRRFQRLLPPREFLRDEVVVAVADGGPVRGPPQGKRVPSLTSTSKASPAATVAGRGSSTRFAANSTSRCPCAGRPPPSPSAGPRRASRRGVKRPAWARFSRSGPCASAGARAARVPDGGVALANRARE